ncbi:hypothetical protein [Pseudoalteromonas spongiae]|uniref:hypothetical protein n=1 Tax=Pseudoalteromonas spongiae TaxID=298657 RepID=UPI0012FD2527|nr:hypothetical protein [Pseudoalteromonas spongiae]
MHNLIIKENYTYCENKRVLCISGMLTQDVSFALKEFDFNELRIGVGTWDDLSILSSLNGKIKKIVINAASIDWDGISSLIEVKSLILTDYMKNQINFSKLVNLSELRIDGREENIEQIYTIKTLESVWLANYKEVNLSKLEKLHNLVILELVDSKKLSSLEGIECFTKLQKLNLVCCTKLEDVDGIKSLSKLKMLRIDSCKKVRLTDDFSSLNNLKYLGIFRQKEILSLLPFKGCRSLEILLVADLKVTDGKVQFIKELPNLKKLIFQHKKHYDENLTSFKRELLEKFGDYEIIEKYFSMV